MVGIVVYVSVMSGIMTIGPDISGLRGLATVARQACIEFALPVGSYMTSIRSEIPLRTGKVGCNSKCDSAT